MILIAMIAYILTNECCGWIVTSQDHCAFKNLDTCGSLQYPGSHHKEENGQIANHRCANYRRLPSLFSFPYSHFDNLNGIVGEVLRDVEVREVSSAHTSLASWYHVNIPSLVIFFGYIPVQESRRFL